MLSYFVTYAIWLYIRSATECLLFPKASGCVAVANFLHRALLTAVFATGFYI